MRKMLIITNSTPIQPRIYKLSQIFKEMKIDLTYLVWDCENDQNKFLSDNIIYHSKKIGYGHPIKKPWIQKI